MNRNIAVELDNNNKNETLKAGRFPFFTTAGETVTNLAVRHHSGYIAR